MCLNTFGPLIFQVINSSLFFVTRCPPVGGGDPTGGSNATPLAAFLLAGAEAELSVVVAGNKTPP